MRHSHRLILAAILLFLAAPVRAAITSFTPSVTSDKTQGTSGGVSGTAPFVARLNARGSTCLWDGGTTGPCATRTRGSQSFPAWITHKDGVSVVWVLSGAGCSQGTWTPTGKSRLIARGSFIDIYVENPGLCHVDVHFVDPHGAQAWTETADFHAADPNVTFAGANTVCVTDDSGTAPTCPGGGTTVEQADLNLGTALATHMGAGKRVLAESGVAWTKSSTETLDANGMQLGPYGGSTFALTDTGSSHPFFNCSGTATGVTVYGINPAFSSTPAGNDDQPFYQDDGGECEDIVFASFSFQTSNANRNLSNLWVNDFRTFMRNSRQFTNRITFVDGTAHHLYGKNGVFAATTQAGFLGTSIRNTTRGTGSSGTSEHVIRQTDHHFWYASNSFLGDISEDRSALTLRATCNDPDRCDQLDALGGDPLCAYDPTHEACDDPHAAGPANLHDMVITQCSDIGSAAGTRVCQSCGAGCGGGTGDPVVTECSTIEAYASSFGMNPGTALGNITACSAQKIGIQNDGYKYVLMDSNGCSAEGNTNGGNRCYTEGGGAIEAVGVNNSARHEEVSTGQFSVFAGTYGENNAAWADNNVSLLCDESTSAINAYCSETDLNPFANSPPSDPPGPADFEIGAGSVLAGVGNVTRSALDIDGNWRDWQGGTYDQGAWAFNQGSAPAAPLGPVMRLLPWRVQ